MSGSIIINLPKDEQLMLLQKILESPKLKPVLDKQKGIRTKDIKGFEMGHKHPSYRYEDAFFPNYAIN